MQKTYSYKTLAAFVLISIFIAEFIKWQYVNNEAMINETIALILFAASLIFKKYNFRKIQYVVFFLLAVFLFNIPRLSFSSTNGDTTTTYYSDTFSFFGINPFVFIVIVIYCAVNWKVLNRLFTALLYGTDEEVNKRQNREMDFYYHKFINNTNEELDSAIKLYKDYPFEAQRALDKIVNERNTSIVKV